MAENLHDDPQVGSEREREAGRGVAQIVDRDRWQAGPRQPDPQVAEDLGVVVGLALRGDELEVDRAGVVGSRHPSLTDLDQLERLRRRRRP